MMHQDSAPQKSNGQQPQLLSPDPPSTTLSHVSNTNQLLPPQYLQQYSLPPPTPQTQQQQLQSAMHLSPQQSSISNRQQVGMIQPSEPALQRLGLNRRLSAHMQRLPSLPNINASPNSASLSPSESVNENLQHMSMNQQQPATAATSASIPPTQSHISIQTQPPPNTNGFNESSLFKNFWGFNNTDSQISPTSTNFPPNSASYQTTPSSYQQQRVNSMTGLQSSNSSSFSLSPNRTPTGNISNTPSAGLNMMNPTNATFLPSNLAMSSLQSQSQGNDFRQQNSFNDMRSRSFAVPKSKFNVSLPTTYESNTANDVQSASALQEFQLQKSQQLHRQFQQQQLQQLALQHQGQQQQQHQQEDQQQQQQRLQQEQQLQHQRLHDHQRRYTQQYDSQYFNKGNNGSTQNQNHNHGYGSFGYAQSGNAINGQGYDYPLESQQQQIIPPMRTDVTMQTYLDKNKIHQNLNLNPPRRESVAAMYHHGSAQHALNNYNNMNTNINMSNMNTNINMNNNVSNMQMHNINNPNMSMNVNMNNGRQMSEISMASIDDMRDHYNQEHGQGNFNNQFLPSGSGSRIDSMNLFEDYIDGRQLGRGYNFQSALLPTPKFMKIESEKDLNPIVQVEPRYRRAAASLGSTSMIKSSSASKLLQEPSKFISPLKALTTDLNTSYSICVPEYNYQASKNPKRVLTKNNKPSRNGGFDNEDYDYILYVNDILGVEENKKYLVIDILGQGTFGQVVKCQNLKTKEIVAVKVVKARQECLQQSIIEGNILEYLTKKVDPKYEKYFVALKDKFMHKYHLCLVFELLSSNLYELIKQNHHHGLNLKLVRTFTLQILEGLCALKEIKMIHCDMKPENILLKAPDKPDLKIIDFGSACQERQTVYTYVQSRFYRSPEVILGVEYTTSVDMWSFGCIVAELFLGLPLFPGTSEYEQLVRIVQTFGMPPSWMMVEKKSNNYIVKERDPITSKLSYRMKSLNEFNLEFNLNESPPKKYFGDTKLDDIINNYQLPNRKSMSKEQIDEEMMGRSCLIHFLKGVLNLSPLERWTPHDAIHHPFVTGEKWTGHWVPPAARFGFSH